MPRPTGLKRRDFDLVLDEGGRARRDGLAVHVRRRSDAGPSRLGLAVRASGAVARNRIKRRLRAAWSGLEAPPGFDVVIRCRGEIEGVDFQELEMHLIEAARAAGLEPAS